MKSIETLQGALFDLLSEYYPTRYAMRFAREHAVVHEQFEKEAFTIANPYSNFPARLKVPNLYKKPIRLQKLQSVGCEASNFHDDETPTDFEIMEKEILSLLHSANTKKFTITLPDILDMTAAFGWSEAKLRMAVRRLVKRKLIVVNAYRGYELSSVSANIQAGVETEGFEADEIADGQTD